MDAFTCDWSGEINFLHHSDSCLLRHAQATSVAATLVVPQRCSAPYWPLLFPDGVHPAEFIKEIVVLPAWESLILPETSGSSLFRGMPNTELWALWLDFRGTGCSRVHQNGQKLNCKNSFKC